MKKIGIVGGVGWQSTVNYYSQLCRLSEQWHLIREPSCTPSIAEITVESLNLARAVSYLGYEEDARSWRQFDDYHRAALNRLEASGAELAIIASITPHHRWQAILEGVEIPVVNIIDEVARESESLGLKRVVLLGTELTMRSRKFQEQFAAYGVAAAGPDNELLRKEITTLIADLNTGHLGTADQRLTKIAKQALRSKLSERAAVCLACTDLPLAFGKLKQRITFEKDGILYINASTVHVRAAFNLAIGA